MNVYVKHRDEATIGCRGSFLEPQDDFGAAVWAMRPSAPRDALTATPKGPAAARAVPWSSAGEVIPTASGRRADGGGELAPSPEPREGRGQVQHDAACRALHPHGELDQSLAQRSDLR